MKKLLLIILTLINLAQMPIVLAAPISHGNLVAIVKLDNSMKPSNSPGIVFGKDQLKEKGPEGAFGNYLLQMLAGGLITLAAPVAIIIIAISGLLAVVSSGTPGLIEKAKKSLTYAIIGLIIIIFSWVVIRAVISLAISTNQNQPAATTQGGQTQTPAGPSGAVGGISKEAEAPPTPAPAAAPK